MSSRLRADCLNVWEVLAQSIAMIGPTITPVLIVPLMYAQAGDAGWLAYVFGAIMLATVALNVNVFASRSATAGSLYVFALRAFGPRGGLFIGWCQLWAYAFVALAGATGFAIFLPGLLTRLHVPISATASLLICVGVAWFLSYRDVRISTIALLVLEGISIALIAVLTALIFIHRGGAWFDAGQFSLHGFSFSALALGTVLAVFSMLGFESATSLGEEAHDPLRTIPRAVLGSVAVAGVFFVITMYAEVLGAHALATPLDKLVTPLDALADSVGAPYMKVPIDIGALLCSISITTAALNGAARALLVMARTGLMPAVFAQTDPVHETPARALGAIALAVAIGGAAMFLAGRAPIDAFSDTASLCSYAFVVIYAAISIGASFFLRALGQLRARNVAVSALAIVFLIVPATGSVYPLPPWPTTIYPLLFLVYAAIGVIILWRRPQTASALALDAGI
jgi:amino acid transporter